MYYFFPKNTIFITSQQSIMEKYHRKIIQFFHFSSLSRIQKKNSILLLAFQTGSIIPASHKIPVPILAKILMLNTFLIQFLNCTLRQYAKSIVELVRIEKNLNQPFNRIISDNDINVLGILAHKF